MSETVEVEREHAETAAWLLEETVSKWLMTRWTDSERQEMREALDGLDNALD